MTGLGVSLALSLLSVCKCDSVPRQEVKATRIVSAKEWLFTHRGQRYRCRWERSAK